jgi:hypothetical protein
MIQNQTPRLIHPEASTFIRAQLRNTIPRKRPTQIVPWVEAYCKFPGSPLGADFRIDKTPWCRQPLEDGNRRGVRRVVFVKPIQSGGSTIGEALICFWSYHWPGGSIGYFWPNNLASELRWKKQTERVLSACKPLQEKLPADNPHAWIDGLIRFNHLNLEMKGVNTDRSVASDTLRAVICEEVHDVNSGWDPGRLRQVFGRMTGYWNSIAYVISNAGYKDSELHKAHDGGTRRQWMARCPGCSNLHHEANWVYHVMRTRWDDERPDLGGLRYELPEDRKRGEEVNYQQIARTVRYQMPCGYRVGNDKTERRNLSLTARYSEPTNPNAQLEHESYSLEGVSVDYIDWLTLIEEKHLALRARKLGDPKPWLVYLRERECQFIGLDDRRPESTPIVLSSRQKDRAGLPNRLWRLCFFDYQKGIKELGESPHWWGVIWDIDAAGNVLLVCEDKLNSEGEVLDMVRRHDVKPICVGVDASFTGEDRYVYFFCLRHGFNAIKVHGQKTGERTFTHGDGVRRAWSEPEPLWPHSANQQGPTKENPDEEPEYWNVSQSGAMDALAHLMARKRPKSDNPNEEESCFEIPADVSEDFKLHFRAWTREKYRVPATNALEERWKKVSEKAPDHLYMCCTYLALWCEMAGATGADLAPPEPAAKPPTASNTALDAP